MEQNVSVKLLMKIIKNSILFNNILFKKLNNKILKQGQKEKYLKIILVVINNLKKKKLKPKFFFFIIIEKLKPTFFFSTIKKKIKKKTTVTYKPYFLSTKQRYSIAIKWLILPAKKLLQKNFILSLEKCFLVFLNSKLKNIGILQKKKTYLIILKYKRFIKF